ALLIAVLWNGLRRDGGQAVAIHTIAGQAPDAVRDGGSGNVSPEEDDILPVALASEVTIIRVEGADTQTLVVGQLPRQGKLELVPPGDVIMTSRSTNPNEIHPVRLIESSSPMIWAKLATETDD